MLRGTAHKYGSNIDTDAIIPARFLNISEADALAKHCMEDLDIDFIKKVKTGDIMVAETNFGCGSSREHAPLAIKACGISAIIAASFARIFFRNAINIGLPLLESAEAVAKTDSGDVIEIDLGKGQIKNVTNNLVFQAKPYPDFMMGIINAGGLVEYTKVIIAGGR
jgi:3-isopropylmalate/(R)-2-methylmalate dehydratase small subunit